MREDRPGRDAGRSGFNNRGQPLGMNDQPFSSGRQVVVERHSREPGLRKNWHGGSDSQGGVFSDSRGGMMAASSSGTVGGFKAFKGASRPF
ncbi:hypothetical protein GOODEAATRI_002938 [Goodea atripinnis]|uniref:Uncharacterized protein n=1 Tax=Goodea atripinnis TaxID=208336 RepID=A0ABV0MQQ7_9TELE